MVFLLAFSSLAFFSLLVFPLFSLLFNGFESFVRRRIDSAG